MPTLRDLAARLPGRTPLLRRAVVSGAGANTDIAVAGIRPGDLLLSVVEVPASAALVDRTAQTTITAADTIRCSQATTGNQLDVWWYAL